MKKRTTTKQISTAITNGLLLVTKAECSYKSSDRIDELSKETFTESLDFLCHSGIFVDAIGWHYEKDYQTGQYIAETGRMNPNTEIIVTVYLDVCNGACKENVEKVLEVTEKE